MRTMLLLTWLMVPILVGAYHYGPGQQRMRTDDVARLLREADQLAENNLPADAKAKYEEALNLLPPEKVHEARRIRLKRANAQMLSAELPQAHQDLNSLVEEMKADAQADEKLLIEARAALANSQYYLTWLMRLEGQPREKWEPEIEASRQTFRYLAEQAERSGDKVAVTKNAEDLESAIRLARMDLSDLQGLPLPSQ